MSKRKATPAKRSASKEKASASGEASASSETAASPKATASSDAAASPKTKAGVESPLSRRAKLAQLSQMLFIVLATFMVYAFVSTAKDGEHRRSCSALCAMSPNYAAMNRRAPDFELPNLDGKKVRLSDYRGKTVILNFWSKSCPPCLEEMPSLAQLAHQANREKDVVVLTITTDESAEDAQTTLQSVIPGKVPFEVLVDSESEVVADKFGTKLFPETWFIDARGVIRARVDGPRDWADPAALELGKSLNDAQSCPIAFTSGQPRGELAHLCDEAGR